MQTSNEQNAAPDKPPPTPTKPCCAKLRGVLDAMPRLRLECTLLGVSMSLSLTLDSAR